MATLRKIQDSTTARRLITPIAAMLLTLALALVSVVFYSANSMDRSAIERQQALTDNALSLRLVQALSELRSVAWWDEMVEKSRAQKFDADWLDIEVGVFVTTSYSHDRILVLDENNKPVYGFGADSRLSVQDQEHFAKLVTPLVQQIRGGRNASPRIQDKTLTSEIREESKITNRTYGRGAAALMSDNGKPVLASIMSITPSIDMSLNSKRPRLLVSIIDVNGKVLHDIGRSILMPDLSFRNRADKRIGTYTLSSDDGKVMGALGWTPKQPGSGLIDQVLPLILILLLATAVTIALLFRRLLASTKQLAAREADARFLADHDALTGLPNRRQLERLFGVHIEALSQRDGQLAIACIDLDRFKDINDTLGHHAGDELIKAVGKRLQTMLSPSDTLARLGGDEFAIVRAVTREATVDALSQMITQCFSGFFEVAGHMIESNASVGIAFAHPNDNFGDTIKRADIALYDAKANGRGRQSFFTTEMAEEIERRHSVQVDLKRALAARELTLNYQPIVEASSGAVTSVEALVRWTSPIHGSVPPDMFISIAEEIGLMAELGRFVIEQAIEDAQRWPDLTTAINISPAQLRSATILSDLLEPARRFGVSPERLTIEITETVLMSSDDRTLRVLRTLKEHGFTLALDDFGTGYSSLAYVRDFPFDKLKIDRSFVKGLSVNDRALAIVEAVVNFGKILGREIVAEGIETEQEMQAMQRAGATHLQGFLFSRALPAEHIEAIATTFGRLSATRTPAKPRQKEKVAIPEIVLPKRKASRRRS